MGLVLAASPNPARGTLRVAVSGMAGPVALTLFDATGRRVWSGTAPETGSAIVDLSLFPGGVYVVRAQGGGGTSASRRVVHLP